MPDKSKNLSEVGEVRTLLIDALRNYKDYGFSIVDFYTPYDRPGFALVHPDGRIWIVSAEAGKVVLTR